MAVKESLRVLFVKLSFLFLGDNVTLLRLQQIHVQLFVVMFLSFLNSSSAEMHAHAEYRSGLGHMFLFKWSFSFLMDSSILKEKVTPESVFFCHRQ